MLIEFEFQRGGVLRAQLVSEAVHTIECVTASMPIEATVLQARWSGREIFVPIRLPKKPPRERQSIRASTGDVIYFCEWGDSYDYTGFEAIGFFYGPEIVREWRGDCPVNVFARILPEFFPLLEEIGDRVWRQGGEGICIRRVDQGAA